MKKRRIIFSGLGGQGIITAAIIFAEAAVMYENLFAVQSQSYGPEARGGAARSDVIISDSKINYPKVLQPNVLICLTQEAYNKFHSIIRPGGLLVSDTRYVKTHQKVDAQHKELPIYRTVMDQIGNPIVQNTCMLGAVVCLTNLIRPDSIIKVLKKRIPLKFIEINIKAFELGISLVKKPHSSQ